MFKTARIVPVFVLSCGLQASLLAPAHALSIIAPAANTETESQGAVAAYSAGGGDTSAAGYTLLSPDEVSHIRWCAKHYRSYHATDNTYADHSGLRTECLSPS
jgi:hypothetical protein